MDLVPFFSRAAWRSQQNRGSASGPREAYKIPTSTGVYSIGPTYTPQRYGVTSLYRSQQPPLTFRQAATLKIPCGHVGLWIGLLRRSSSSRMGCTSCTCSSLLSASRTKGTVTRFPVRRLAPALLLPSAPVASIPIPLTLLSPLDSAKHNAITFDRLRPSLWAIASK